MCAYNDVAYYSCQNGQSIMIVVTKAIAFVVVIVLVRTSAADIAGNTQGIGFGPATPY